MKTELTKCSNPKDIALCEGCKRNQTVKESEDSSAFPLRESRMSGWHCDGYVSKRETETLF